MAVLRHAAIAASCLCLLALAGCGGKGNSSPDSPPAASAPPGPGTTTPPPPATTPAPPPTTTSPPTNVPSPWSVAPALTAHVPPFPDPSTTPAGQCTPKTCTVTVDHQGPFRDLVQWGMGWGSARRANLGDGRKCFLYMFGRASSPPDNSVRCMDPATGTFTYVRKNGEKGSAEAYATSIGLDTSDNNLSLMVPGRGILIAGGAYLQYQKDGKLVTKPYVDGFFDFKTMKFVYRNQVFKQLFLTRSPDHKFSVFNPAMAWSRALNVGFIYGGTVHGAGPTSEIALVYPQPDGYFDIVPVSAPNPNVPGGGVCTFTRNNAVAVGDWVYVASGHCKVPGKGLVDTNWFRRFNLRTHAWQELTPLPAPRRLPQLTYDSKNGYIVLYAGNGGKGLQEGDAGYWAGQNNVWIWNVAKQGPWQDITTLANLPYLQMPVGAYDPDTGWTCYRGGKMYDSSGKQLGWTKGSKVYCIRLHFTKK